ncbi:MAG: hypothetical protein KF830_15635 [Planctomycetes bacterium]|nr:hypothetical protein [Planctomycetota bacterium]
MDGPTFAVGDAVTEESVERAVEECERLGTGPRRQERLVVLQGLDGTGRAGVDAAADLGLLLATLLVPDLSGFPREQAAALAALRALAR